MSKEEHEKTATQQHTFDLEFTGTEKDLDDVLGKTAVAPEQFKAALETVLSAAYEAYGLRVCYCTDDSSLGDFVAFADEDAPKRMSEIIGFLVSGEERFYNLALRVAQNARVAQP